MCCKRDFKLNGKGEVMFGEEVGRVSGVAGGRRWPYYSEWWLRCVVDGRRCHSGLCGLG